MGEMQYVQILLSFALVALTAALVYFTRQYTQATQQNVRVTGQMVGLMVEELELKNQQNQINRRKALVWRHFCEIPYGEVVTSEYLSENLSIERNETDLILYSVRTLPRGAYYPLF